MKQIVLISIFLSLYDICHTKQCDHIEMQTDINIRITRLKKAYDKKDYLTFYKNFPNTFDELEMIYGFEDNIGKKPLYDISFEHINYFFEFKDHIALDEFIVRCYKISENGIWEADAVAYFQINLTNLVIKHPKEVVEMLNTLSKKEEKAFWFFVFDGSSKNDIGNKEKFKIVYKIIDTICTRHGKILQETFNEMY